MIPGPILGSRNTTHWLPVFWNRYPFFAKISPLPSLKLSAEKFVEDDSFPFVFLAICSGAQHVSGRGIISHLRFIFNFFEIWLVHILRQTDLVCMFVKGRFPRGPRLLRHCQIYNFLEGFGWFHCNWLGSFLSTSMIKKQIITPPERIEPKKSWFLQCCFPFPRRYTFFREPSHH